MTGHVVLVGLMGSGKTTIGELLARRLDRPFVDTDAVIELDTGRTVREIWLDEGEGVFRRLETRVLVDSLADHSPCVIAAAGGVVLAAGNRQLLVESEATVVWLRADPSVLAARAATGIHRPLLDQAPLEAMERMERERTDLYRDVATIVVDVGAAGPGAVVDKLAAAIGGSS